MVSRHQRPSSQATPGSTRLSSLDKPGSRRRQRRTAQPAPIPPLKRWSSLSWSLIALSCIAWGGCGSVDPLPLEIREQLLDPRRGLEIAGTANSTEHSLASRMEAANVTEENWIDPAKLPWTYAEVLYFRGGRIGYSLVSVTSSTKSDSNQLHIVRTDVIDRNHDGTPAPLRQVTYESTETPNGNLISFKFRSTVDEQPDLEVEGRMIFEKMDVSRNENDGRPRRTQQAWEPGAWGPMGVQSMLIRKPMVEGEIREVQFYLPQLGQFAKAQLVAKTKEKSPIAGDAAPELLSIDVFMGNNDTAAQSRIWIDDQGIIQKTVTLSGETIQRFRVDESLVQRLADQGQFGRLVNRAIPLTGRIDLVGSSDSLTLRVQSLEIDPYRQVIQNGRQEVRSINAGVCRVKLSKAVAGVDLPSPASIEDSTNLTGDDSQAANSSASGEADPVAGSDTREPDGEVYLATSSIVPTTNPLIASIAQELLPAASAETPTRRLERLHGGLFASWSRLPVTPDIKSTLVAARTRTGSCVELASVMTALLRQQQIPARLVGGLLVDPSTSSARFHVWVQAKIDNQWHDVDATLEHDLVSPCHMAMTTTASAGDNPYQSWISLLKVLNEISEIEVIQE